MGGAKDNSKAQQAAADKSYDAQVAAAQIAAAAQNQGLQMAIDENRNAYVDSYKNLSPYLNAGYAGLNAYKGLLGLSGAEAQQKQIAGIESMPGFQEQIKYGENALLQNASATGGLRGGNAQTSLAQFRPMLLNQAIQQQLGQLGNFQQQGFNAINNLNNARLGASSGISNAYSQMGSANANAALTAGNRPFVAESAAGPGKLQGALSGAATGASAGAAFGPWGAGIGGAVGAIGGAASK